MTTVTISRNGHSHEGDTMTAILDRPMTTDAPVSIFAGRQQAEVFTRYRVKLQFTDMVMGGIPQKPELIESWLRQRMLGGDEELRIQTLRVLEEISEDDLPVIPADATRDQIIEIAGKIARQHNGCTFYRDRRGLCLADYQVKAALKEATAILYPWQDGHKWGPTKKAARSAVAEWLFVDEHRISLGRTEPDGVHTQVGHVTGPKGPRSTLTYYDYCQYATVSFTISSLYDRVEREQWERILVLAEKLGLGALRSLSHGQFAVTSFERL